MLHLSIPILISFILLGIGTVALLALRTPLMLFLAIELLFNGANLLFILCANMWGNATGLVWVFFILLIAAIEAGVGLSLLIHLFRANTQRNADDYSLLKMSDSETTSLLDTSGERP